LFAYSRQNSRSPAPKKQIDAEPNALVAERGMTVGEILKPTPQLMNNADKEEVLRFSM
jgi:hypothetical protein